MVLLREDEENTVKKLFNEKLGIHVKYIEAQEIFLEKLKGISNPENKRKIIGEEFAKFLQNLQKRKAHFNGLHKGHYIQMLLKVEYPQVRLQ